MNRVNFGSSSCKQEGETNADYALRHARNWAVSVGLSTEDTDGYVEWYARYYSDELDRLEELPAHPDAYRIFATR